MAADDPIAVTDTTPLIALTGVGELRLLGQLFGRLIVPLDVWIELSAKSGAREPDELLSLHNVQVLPSPEPPPEALQLGLGERAALALALSTPGSCVLVDERAARRVAQSLHLPVSGTLGVLLEARRRALVPAVKPLVERLQANGYRVSDALVRAVLEAASEA